MKKFTRKKLKSSSGVFALSTMLVWFQNFTPANRIEKIIEPCAISTTVKNTAAEIK